MCLLATSAKEKPAADDKQRHDSDGDQEERSWLVASLIGWAIVSFHTR